MFELSILTPENTYFKGSVYSLIVPGGLGYLQILTNHAPIISTVKNGDVIVVDENKKEYTYDITGGILEVQHNQAVLLVDFINKATHPHIEVGGLV